MSPLLRALIVVGTLAVIRALEHYLPVPQVAGPEWFAGVVYMVGFVAAVYVGHEVVKWVMEEMSKK